MIGLIIGAVIGGALGYYFAPSGSTPTWEWRNSQMSFGACSAIGALIGLVVGSLVCFYLGN
jgi:hypothetical protein